MFVGNFKSFEDEKTKRLLEKDLLQIMADNELEKERRVRDFKSPYKPAIVPPVYKTIAERRADALEQEKQAITNLGTLVDFTSQELLFVINKIRSSDIADGLFNFNSFFPQIKNRMVRTLNPKLLTPEFLAKNIIDYLRTATSSNPLVDASETANAYNKFRGRYALRDDYELFLDKYRLFFDKLNTTDGAESILDGVYALDEDIQDLKKLFVENAYLEELKQNITTNELDGAVKLIEKYYFQQKIPDITLLATIEKDMNNFINNSDFASAQKVLNTLGRRVYSVATIKNENKFEALMKRLDQFKTEDIEKRVEIFTQGSRSVVDAGVEEQKGGDFEDLDEMADPEGLKVGDNYADEIISDLAKMFREGEYVELKKDMLDMLVIIIDGYKTKNFTDKITDADERGLTAESLKKELKNYKIIELGDMTELLGYLERLSEVLDNYIKAKRIVYRKYNPEGKDFAYSAYKPTSPKKGFGLGHSSQGVVVKDHTTRGGSGASPWGTSPHDGVKGALPFSMRGSGLSSAYNNVSRKFLRQTELMSQHKLNQSNPRGRKPAVVGRGILVEIPEDTYKTFGKHIIHYPQLRDTNVLNIKYPSKSKNFTPKMVISQEYRDLIMDILERGNYTNTLLDKLGDDEREHFHKVVKGAGLMEQFKLKPQTNNKMKELGARFKVLRGQFLAGNNAPTLITELRSIVLTFIEKGVIQKQDGYDMLKELS